MVNLFKNKNLKLAGFTKIIYLTMFNLDILDQKFMGIHCDSDDVDSDREDQINKNKIDKGK